MPRGKPAGVTSSPLQSETLERSFGAVSGGAGGSNAGGVMTSITLLLHSCQGTVNVQMLRHPQLQHDLFQYDSLKCECPVLFKGTMLYLQVPTGQIKGLRFFDLALGVAIMICVKQESVFENLTGMVYDR